jgi:hypothetical protein
MLLSNGFILILFNFYLNVNNCINMLYEIKFDDLNLHKHRKNIYSIFPLTTQARSFSTSSQNNNINDNDFEIDPEIENLTNEQKVKSLSSDPEFRKKYLEYQKAKPDTKTLKAFKKAYGGGYLGYTKIHNLGNVSQFYQSSQVLFYSINNLTDKLKDYVNEVPENVVFSILPVLS